MIHQTMIGGTVDAAEGDSVFIVDENFEILPRFKMHLIPHRARKDDLPLLRKNGGHGGKILPFSRYNATPFIGTMPFFFRVLIHPPNSAIRRAMKSRSAGSDARFPA